jgi:hypothetical protein
MRLNIPPTEMWKMPFYDIMLLYKSYADYVDEENKSQEEQQAKYQEEMEEQKAAMNVDNYKVPDLNNISRGMINNAMSNFNIPKI